MKFADFIKKDIKKSLQPNDKNVLHTLGDMYAGAVHAINYVKEGKANSEGIRVEQNGVLTKQSPVLSSENHGVFFGKFPKKSTFGTKTSIYKEENILTLLAWLQTHLKEGMRGKIYLGHELSQLFNGEEKLKGYVQESKVEKYMTDLIQKATKATGVSYPMDIILFRDLAPDLFTLLYRARSSGGKEAMQQAIRAIPISTIQTPEEITAFLFRAVEIFPAFFRVLWKTVPEAQQKKIEQTEQDVQRRIEQLHAILYGCVELGIRISLLLKGMEYQMGVERQKVYDLIITTLLRSSEKKEKESFPKEVMEYMQPLKGRLVDRDFHGIYALNEEHIFQVDATKRALKKDILKMTTVGVLGIAVGTGGTIATQKYMDKQETGRMNAYFKVHPQKEYGFEKVYTLDSERSVERIRKIENVVAWELYERYGIVMNNQQKALCRELLIKDSDRLLRWSEGSENPEMYKGSKFALFVDWLVYHYAGLFPHTQGEPYAHRSPTQDQLIQMLHPSAKNRNEFPQSYVPKKVGSYMYSYNTKEVFEYTFYQIGDRYIAQKRIQKANVFLSTSEKHIPPTEEVAAEGAMLLLLEGIRSQYMIMPERMRDDLMNGTSNQPNYPFLPLTIEQKEEGEISKKQLINTYGENSIDTYVLKDPLGGFGKGYELILEGYNLGTIYARYLGSADGRIPPDETYTMVRGEEVKRWFQMAQDVSSPEELSGTYMKDYINTYISSLRSFH